MPPIPKVLLTSDAFATENAVSPDPEPFNVVALIDVNPAKVELVVPSVIDVVPIVIALLLIALGGIPVSPAPDPLNAP